jgi:hypothetical protein
VAEKQYELCLEILRRFKREKLLGNLILIGSWCLVFYEDYFHSKKGVDAAALKTRDIDFLIPSPSKIAHKTDVPALFKDLGFVVTIGGSNGLIRLSHPDLILEFLVPERGRGEEKPVNLPQLGMNATALRFLNFLTENIIPIKVEDFHIYVPHPVNFALHKLIVSQRRSNKDKSTKDSQTAVRLLNDLIVKGEGGAIRRVFNAAPAKWRKEMLKGLDPLEDRKIIELLEG